MAKLLFGASGFIDDLRGVAFARRPYRRWSQAWDHDHCEGCNAGFSEDHPTDLHEGWTTTPDYEPGGAEWVWICDDCFEEYRERLDWRQVADDRPLRPAGLNDGPLPEAQPKEPPHLHDES